MTEQPARSAREPHVPSKHLTFTEAAERLHITPNAVRMRVHRGSLASVRVNDRTFVVWPQPAQVHAQRTHDARDERADERATTQNDDRLIARLESENAYLRQTLDAEIEARRRADHLVAGMIDERRTLMAEIAELQASATEHEAETVNAPVDAQDGLGRTDPLEMMRRTLHNELVPSEVSLAVGWRRWWRKLVGS